MRRTSLGARPYGGTVAVRCLALVLLAGCQKIGIDTTGVPALSNEDTYATLGYIWSGARAAITSKKEPTTSTFNLQLATAASCPIGGQGSYQGTLVGTDTSGSGSATLAMTASLASCSYDDGTVIRKIVATGISLSGTIAITGDAYGATNLHLTVASMTVNGTKCDGGIDMTIVATAPAGQATASGTACARSGAVPLP